MSKISQQFCLLYIYKQAKKKIADGLDAPMPGERVSYIVVKGSEKSVCKRTRDPIDVLEKELEVDYDYYLKQIKSSITRNCTVYDTEELSQLFPDKPRSPEPMPVNVPDLEDLVLKDYENCQKCQGANFGRVKCCNTDCDRFFIRQQNLQKLKRFKHVSISYNSF